MVADCLKPRGRVFFADDALGWDIKVTATAGPFTGERAAGASLSSAGCSGPASR